MQSHLSAALQHVARRCRFTRGVPASQACESRGGRARIAGRTAALLLLAVARVPQAGGPELAREPFAAVRKEFLEAYRRAEQNSGAAAAAAVSDSPALEAYPLYPYLQAARIRRALHGAKSALGIADARAGEFLARHDGEPVSVGLRRAWLRSLSERGEEQAFLKQYRADVADEELRCRWFNGRIAAGATDGLAGPITDLWRAPRRLPDACGSAFAWLRKQGELPPELIEERVRRVLRAGHPALARELVTLFRVPSSERLLQWARLIQSPREGIDALIAQPDTAVDAEALQDGWARLARRDPEAARARYESLVRSQQLTPLTASPYALSLGLALAWSHEPDALQFFERALPSQIDDTAREWQARAALWAGNWNAAAAAIDAMSPALRQSSRWQYWAARSAEQKQDSARARELYKGLLGEGGYYSALAAARLGQAVELRPKPVPRNEAELKACGSRPGLVRARELYLSGLAAQALAELQQGSRQGGACNPTLTVQLASSWGWHDIAIITASQQNWPADYPLLYPRPFDPLVRDASASNGLPRPLIYALLRQESLYRSDAVSPAGALGLLQLRLPTARQEARRRKERLPSRSDLLQPEPSIRLGSRHLRALLDRFDAQLPLALSAYNAGPANAIRWLPDQTLPADVWIENIPYNETRSYVQRVLWQSVVFEWLETSGTPTTTHWLADIQPAGGAVPAPVSSAQRP